MKLYNTLDKKVVPIKPLEEGKITIYNCGPTVYFRMHIGNIRAYVNWDVLYRALKYTGYEVERVMNMTDVGHMSSDEDFGEDKIEQQALKEGKDPISIANYYIKTVLEDFATVNILSPKGNRVDPNMDLSKLQEEGWTRATKYIDEMIEMIKKIEANGYTYETTQAVYFDVTKIDNYNIFTGQTLEEKQEGVRKEVGVDSEKKHPADFVLWMKRVGKYKEHIMHWDSPWGDGFPGWHIECSAMSTSVLGEYFDIHTGGIDHISIHHPNERAQNIGAFGHPSVKYWIHNDFLIGVEDVKISKSTGKGASLSDALELGFDPMDIRYLFASVNYRVQLKYTKESLKGARNARLSLISKMKNIYKEASQSQGEIIPKYKQLFIEELESNLNVSGALAVISQLIKSSEKAEDVLTTIYDFDKVLGLNLKDDVEQGRLDIPKEILNLASERVEARKAQNYQLADEKRIEIEQRGYKMVDTKDGFTLEEI
ncbi:MAG: cysteine--tRNA ligase [Candidatus Dojkabacteria bacterium]|jgi:cysteinyl-tRNA synthetase|nr:cysteine--tRNA ligase [Candidatus Dojkabacteria bacterium]